MDISDIRRLNFWSLIHPNGYTTKGIVDCRKLMDLNQKYIRSFVKKDPAEAGRTKINSSLARKIEKCYDKPEGWLDRYVIYSGSNTEEYYLVENENNLPLTSDQIRLHNVILLIEKKYDGNKSKFSKAIGKSSSYASGLYAKKREGYGLAILAAREIEQKLKIASGYLDIHRFIVLSNNKLASEEEREMIERYNVLNYSRQKRLLRFLSFLEQETED